MTKLYTVENGTKHFFTNEAEAIAEMMRNVSEEEKHEIFYYEIAKHELSEKELFDLVFHSNESNLKYCSDRITEVLADRYITINDLDVLDELIEEERELISFSESHRVRLAELEELKTKVGA